MDGSLWSRSKSKPWGGNRFRTRVKVMAALKASFQAVVPDGEWLESNLFLIYPGFCEVVGSNFIQTMHSPIHLRGADKSE